MIQSTWHLELYVVQLGLSIDITLYNHSNYPFKLGYIFFCVWPLKQWLDLYPIINRTQHPGLVEAIENGTDPPGSITHRAQGQSQPVSGWWLTYPSEKWWSESQLGWWHSQLNGKIKNVPNHQPGVYIIVYVYIYIIYIYTLYTIHYTHCNAVHEMYSIK